MPLKRSGCELGGQSGGVQAKVQDQEDNEQYDRHNSDYKDWAKVGSFAASHPSPIAMRLRATRAIER